MSYAWRQLQSAIRSLAGTGDRRDQLQAALGKLIKLKPRDLPSEVMEDFNTLVGGISRFPVRNIPQEIKAEVEALSDAEVMESTRKIKHMHDAVHAYQPHPVKHTGGLRNRAVPVPSWPASALPIKESSQGVSPAESGDCYSRSNIR